MSKILDAAACADAQRREDLARTDAQLGDWPQRIALVPVCTCGPLCEDQGAPTCRYTRTRDVDDTQAPSYSDEFSGCGADPLTAGVKPQRIARAIASAHPMERSKITDAWHRANDARALALQQQHLDAMRRAGL